MSWFCRPVVMSLNDVDFDEAHSVHNRKRPSTARSEAHRMDPLMFRDKDSHYSLLSPLESQCGLNV